MFKTRFLKKIFVSAFEKIYSILNVLFQLQGLKVRPFSHVSNTLCHWIYWLTVKTVCGLEVGGGGDNKDTPLMLLYHTPTIFLEIKVQQRTSTPAPPPKLEKNAILNIPHTQAVTRKPSCIYRTFGQHCYWSGLSLAYQLTWLHLFSPGPK